MGFALLWIESLVAALLLIAAATAYRALFRKPADMAVDGGAGAPDTFWMIALRRAQRKQLLPKTVLVLAVALPVIIGAGETGVAACLASRLIEHSGLAYQLSWLICLLAGSALVLWCGLRRTEGVRGAASWPAGRLAAGGAAVLALHLMTLWNMDTNMRLNLSALRLEAGAMAVAAASPRPPDQENAAFLYEKAFVLIKQVNDQDSPWKETYQKKAGKWYSNYSKRDYESKDPELRGFLKAHQPTLALLRRAAAMQGCFFERNYAQISPDLPLPELAQLRECGRLLGADARCKAADGQVRAALENVAVMQAVSRHVGSEPILISGLVSIAIDSLATDTLEGILVSCQPTASDLAALPQDDTVSYQRILRRSWLARKRSACRRLPCCPRKERIQVQWGVSSASLSSSPVQSLARCGGFICCRTTWRAIGDR